MILVDSNIWIDLIQKDPVWLNWSLAEVQKVRAQKRAVINPVIYAELAPRTTSQRRLTSF